MLSHYGKQIGGFLKKLNIESPHNPAFLHSIIHIASIWKNPNYPLSDGRVKIDVIHTPLEYYSAVRMKEILPFATMQKSLEDIMLSEIRQRHILDDLTYVWNVKTKTNKQKLELIETYSRIVVNRGRGLGNGVICWSKGINFQL